MRKGLSNFVDHVYALEADLWCEKTVSDEAVTDSDSYTSNC